MDVQKIISEVQLREKGVNEFQSLEYVQCLHFIQNRARVLRRGKWEVSKVTVKKSLKESSGRYNLKTPFFRTVQTSVQNMTPKCFFLYDDLHMI